MDDTSLQKAIHNAWPQLVDFLSHTPEWVLQKAKQLLPQMDVSQVEGIADHKKKISLVLDMFRRSADASIFKGFMQSVCMECNLPMELEIVCMSVSGEGHVTPLQEDFEETDMKFPSTSTRIERRRPWNSPSTSNNGKQSKQQRLDSAERYRQRIITAMLQRYGGNRSEEAAEGETRQSAFGQAFVNLVIRQSKACKIKGKAKDEPIALHDVEEHSDATMKLPDLFESMPSGATNVILLLGKPGMGKTRLVNKICQQWAEGMLPQYQVIFLFEFRQLNLISRRLSLRELLFDFFLHPEDCPDAAFEHLLEDAQHALLIFDGMDEFVGNIKRPPFPNSWGLDNLRPLFVSELFASLCHGSLLPGCTVLVTTRPKMLPNNLLKTVTLLAEIWGFDHEKVEEFASYFFYRSALKNQAIACLKSSSKLRSMCYIPALCNIVCICLEYLLLQDVGSVRLPQTVTQFYVQMVLIFIHKLSGVSEETDMSQHQAAMASLCELAFKGLEEKKVLFYTGEVPENTRNFALLYGLLLAFKVKASNVSSQDGYTFIHFSFQEFFAALFLLTSKTIDDNCLREKFFLRSKWILKKEAKMTFTENCHIFLSGLSSQRCRQFLSSLAGQNESWIQARQAIITQMLRKLATGNLTGPKVVELCHCVYETQDIDLAQCVGAQLNFNYQFRNFRLMPLDMTNLAFVIHSSPNLVSLGFVGCPMELEYLDVLASCENIKNLSFQSRRYGNEFAAVLSKSLPKIKCLTTFQLAGGNISISGLENLLQAFADCHQLEDINLQDNKMKEQEMTKIIEMFSTMEKLKKIDLSHNKISANTILAFCRAAVVSPNVTELHIRKNTLIINFTGHSIKTGGTQHLGINEEETIPRAQALKLRLQDCQLYPQHAKEIASILGSCSHLSEIDLSGNHLGDEGCRKLMETLPKISISGPLNLNNNQLSLESIFCLLHSMRICPNIEKLEVSLHQKTALLTLANKTVTDASRSRSYSLNDDQLSADEGRILAISRKISLMGNSFHGEDLENLYLALRSCCSVTELDLSNNSLGDLGVLKVAELLPDMKALHSLILNQNHISLGGVFCLVRSFSTLEQMISIHLDLGETQAVHLSFGDGSRPKLTAEHQEKSLVCPQHSVHARRFSLRNCAMAPEDVASLFGILNTCSGLSEINFSGNTLSDQGIEQLLKFLPHLHSLKLLSIKNNTFSRNCVLMLANSFNLCERICEVEVRSSENAFLHFVDSPSREIHCRLIDCSIGQDDIKELCVILEKSACLAELDLSRNCLGNDGLRCLLEHLPKIHISCLLKIGHNGISQDGVLCLANALATYPNVAEVYVSLCSEETLVITLARENNPQKILRLKQCSFQAEQLAQLAAMIGKCSALTDFMLANNGLTLSDAKALFEAPRKLAGVLRMGIEEPWVKNESLVGLLKLAAEVQGNITEVMIRRDTSLFVVEQGFRHPAEKVESVVSRLHQCELKAKGVPFLPKLIEKCSQLCALNCSEVQLTDPEAATISDARLQFPALKRLELTCCSISPFGIGCLAEALNRCQVIEDINVSKCNLGIGGLSALVNALEGKQHLTNINLGFLNLESRSTLKLISKLSTVPLLRSLVLNNNNLSSEVCPHLAEMLKNAIHMEEINFSYNKIEDAGIKEIAMAVPEMKNLKRINLSHNSIGAAGGQCFVEALASSQQVEELRLSGNNIGHETVAKLATILPSVHCLKVLHLSSCNIDSEGMSHLAKALSECPQIQELSLSENRIGNKGIKSLLEGLPHSSQLRKLELKMCGIDDSVSKPLASGVSRCALLEEVILSWNALGDESTLELAQILPGMESLRVLDLDYNKITDSGIRKLAEELARCRRIHSVRLWHNRISKEVERNLNKEEPRLHFSA